MPGLARKVIVCAAVDGLILQPLSSKKDQRQPAPVKIQYGNAAISAIPRDLVPDTAKSGSSFEAFGIVGLITVTKSSYLISITKRQQVALIRGFPVYVVTEVALTPCSSQAEAREAIARTALHLNRRAGDRSSDESDCEGDQDVLSSSDEVGDDMLPSGYSRPKTRSSSTVAQDVIGRRGSYGRFAQRWFSKGGWLQDQKRTLGLSNSIDEEAVIDSETGPGQDKPPSVAPVEGKLSDDAGDVQRQSTTAAASSLLPKLLRTTQILLGSSRSFFFSYEYDITRSFLNRDLRGSSEIPLYKQVEPLYFWNRNTVRPFIDAGLDSLVLPLMQGFVGQRSFVMDSDPPQFDDTGAKESLEMSEYVPKDGDGVAPQPGEAIPAKNLRRSERQFDITLISRRSVKRAGLRYLRRGVDEEGSVANNVETEQILSPTTWKADSKLHSFIQVRGSIPLFFTQSPYSLKPVPVLQHSKETNYQAMEKHFCRLRERYGSLQVVNLVEKHGIESPLGDEFERSVKQLNEEGHLSELVAFEWFDFHHACRGMKFENVSLLLDILGSKLTSFGSSVMANGELLVKQRGIFRTNCMDCLDRTNVCQSSFAKAMLDLQLKEQGFDVTVQRDQEVMWFNTLWADNGDAISKQYASTAAMKGDYTRTRKRDYRGTLTDMGLSLSRYFNGLVNDFFLQTTIDFLLGNVTSMVFDEFEADMMTKDPAVSMQKMRQQAIELCQKRVVADESEELAGGWTMLTPHQPDSVQAQPFDEAVLLLTDAALYLCRFDWNLDKVSSFERVELAHVTRVRLGTYITSTFSPVQTDEARNVGLLISYKPGSNDITRINTRSMSSFIPPPGSESGTSATPAGISIPHPPVPNGSKPGAASPATPAVIGFLSRSRTPQPPPDKKIALKVPYSQSSSIADAPRSGGPRGLSETEQAVAISLEIERLVLLARRSLPSGQGQTTSSPLQQVSHSSEAVASLTSPTAAGKDKIQGGEETKGQQMDNSSSGSSGIIEKGDIVSLAEAKRSTGLLEQLGHSLKKLVWA